MPKSCSFVEGEREVLVRREGRKIILEPADEWSDEFLACLGAWPEPIERPPGRRLTELGDPFE